jgi:hypothetical protein
MEAEVPVDVDTVKGVVMGVDMLSLELVVLTWQTHLEPPDWPEDFEDFDWLPLGFFPVGFLLTVLGTGKLKGRKKRKIRNYHLQLLRRIRN